MLCIFIIKVNMKRRTFLKIIGIAISAPTSLKYVNVSRHPGRFKSTACNLMKIGKVATEADIKARKLGKMLTLAQNYGAGVSTLQRIAKEHNISSIEVKAIETELSKEMNYEELYELRKKQELFSKRYFESMFRVGARTTV